MLVNHGILEDLYKDAGEGRKQRAINYQKQGRVKIKNVEYENELNFSLSANVIGTENYRTYISVKNGEIEDVTCTCEDYYNHYGVCKHTLASVLEFINNPQYIGQNVNKTSKNEGNILKIEKTEKQKHRNFKQIVNTFYQEEIQTESLPPFQAGIEEKAPIIMVSHNKIESYDSTAPASLSKPLHDLLREMGFTGLILTDDLDMAAIQEDLNGENEAVKAFLAGNDLIMTSSYEEDLNALEEAIENDTIKEEDLNERVKKILAFKYQYQIIKKENLSNGG